MLLVPLLGCALVTDADLAARMDVDGDGLARPTDCDDADAAVGQYTWYADTDGDGHGGAGAVYACVAPEGFVAVSDDCDDADATVVTYTWYADVDLDGFGDPATAVSSCEGPRDDVEDGTDCDDTDPDVHPGARDYCDDGRDNDCNGILDDLTWYVDADSDNFGDPGTATVTCEPAAGYVEYDTDCDDTNPDVHPYAPEVCDDVGIDENCNGLADDADPGVTGTTYWYPDQDGDGYGSGTPTISCAAPAGRVADDGDCDDGDPAVNPGAAEVWYDGVDQDCDRNDIDQDGDGFAATGSGGDDCDDTDPSLGGDGDGDGACDWLDYTAFVGLDMVLLPAGSFTMGGGAGDPDRDYTDHTVTLSRGFWMARTELTKDEWALDPEHAGWVYDPTSCDEDCPADSLEWTEAAVYANWLSTSDGLDTCYVADGSDVDAAWKGDLAACPGYRLPTEAEWEYAARADEDTIYAGSDVSAEVAWTYANAGALNTQTHSTCTLAANAWGLCDLSGNLYEWTDDWYASADYAAAPVRDPFGATSGSYKVIRGGAWDRSDESATVAHRADGSPTYANPVVGVRLVRSVVDGS